jgi:hypothetical protein
MLQRNVALRTQIVSGDELSLCLNSDENKLVSTSITGTRELSLSMRGTKREIIGFFDRLQGIAQAGVQIQRRLPKR